MINEAKKRPVGLIDHLPRRPLYAAVQSCHVAQSVERSAVNRGVAGSSPAVAAKSAVTENKPRHGNSVTENKPSVTKKRGRPKSEVSMSQAERARAYRLRKQS